MTYAELLKQYIKDSRYTLEEISKQLLDRGLSASREHLSRLQNGKVPPASDDINTAIAEITNGDSDKLMWYAYVEKAPEGFKEILYQLGEEIIPAGKRLLGKYPGFFDGNFQLNELEQSNEYKEFLDEYRGAITTTLFTKGLDLPVKDPQGVKRLLDKYGEYKPSKESDLLIHDNGNGYNLEKIEKVVLVPVLGYIAAGTPIFADEHIEEYMEILNPGKYENDELFVLIVKGDSMEGSRIFKGDRVVVRIQSEVENGEIAVVNVDGENATLKKVKKYDDGSVWLISTNEKYAPIPLTNKRARIVGKVIQVIFEP
jgi:SOS regulatory protein LexA